MILDMNQQILLERVCIAVPMNVSNNVAFVVDTWKLSDVWDCKCDDMGSWINHGRKKMSKKGLTGKYAVYRQFYYNASLPSFKKSVYRYIFIQYISNNGEQTVTVKSHGFCKKRMDIPYKRSMPSTTTPIKKKGV